MAKVLIATELLATGQMTGGTEATAYQMITQSDDDAADGLYGLAGGDDVVNLVAARYDIPFLGTPPELSGCWGNTEITAKGMVYLYAAIARDPTVGPWLMNAMARATEYGADGTYQYFGTPSATTGAAIKQGWGDDGDDSPDAVFNSTGYVDDDRYAVAILTDGSPSTYGAGIGSVVTAQARALMPSGQIDDPAAHDPVLSAVTVTASGSTVHLTGTAVDPDSPSAALPVRISEGDATLATTATQPATHRFDVDFVASDGPHSYAVTVGNVGEGNAASQATPSVDVNGDPRGAVAAVTGGVGTITIEAQESDRTASPSSRSASMAGPRSCDRSTRPTTTSRCRRALAPIRSPSPICTRLTVRTSPKAAGRSRSPGRRRPGTPASWSRRSPPARRCCWAWSSAISGCTEPADGRSVQPDLGTLTWAAPKR